MYFGDDRKLLDSATAVVKETVAQLPIAEQSEYNKRLRTYQHCFAQKNKLVKERNGLYENYQLKLKESNKSKLFALICAFAYMVANWFFNFDSENKAHILNMLQYTMLTIIPVLLILRGIKHIIPDEDESKGSLEILFESLGQVILIMLAIWFLLFKCKAH